MSKKSIEAFDLIIRSIFALDFTVESVKKEMNFLLEELAMLLQTFNSKFLYD